MKKKSNREGAIFRAQKDKQEERGQIYRRDSSQERSTRKTFLS